MSAAAIQGSQFIGRKVSEALLKVVIKDVAKRAAAKQTKWFPFVGQAVSASISYYFMSKLGKDHINKCEKVINNLQKCYNRLEVQNLYAENDFKRIEFSYRFW